MSETDAGGRPALAAHVIFVRYVLFAVISSAANLVSQEAVVRLIPPAPLSVSLLVGTGIGFLVKYLLEKRWVFLDAYEDHASEARKIVVYGAFGVLTTALFWGIEMGAWHVWQSTAAKYVGGAIGLALGNWLKYQLDKHYVFARTPA